MSIGKKFTYWNYIQEHGVAIPLIQRDYAQGREGKAELRKRFLVNLNDALRNNDANNPLILDFVYGVKDKNGNIIPLDGQQRLTTLWLLHWYLYLKSNKNITKDNLNILLKFTYQTRISSRKFCEELCKNEHFHKLRQLEKNNAGNIRYYITNQTWFMAEWEQDPTVKAMLNMLGGKDQSIESIFNNCDFEGFWSKLIIENKCPIVFYYLPIDGEIQQEPDDIYIKVNARGEHLTDFENFKADLIKYVRADKQKQWQNISNDEHPDLAISKLIDTDWTDVFWNDLPNECKKIDKNPPESTGTKLPNIDRQFFAFLNRYFLNLILATTEMDAKALNQDNTTDKDALLFQYLYGKDGKADVTLTYKDFQKYLDGKVITPDNFVALKTIFAMLKDKKKVDTQPSWDTSSKENFKFLPYLTKIDKTDIGEHLASISQVHRVVFFGICCYLENCNTTQGFDINSFREWMRFIWNIAYNSDIQTVDNMKKTIAKINGVREGTHNIIEALRKEAVDDQDSYLGRQWNEEIMKAKMYDKNESIQKAEKLFHGSIRFLIKDDGILKNYINRAKELLKDGSNNQWIFEILPFFQFDSSDPKIIVTFAEKKRDLVEIINRDNNIIKAVQAYLENPNNQQSPNEKWINTLLDIRKENTSLFDYSESKKIQSHSCSNNAPKCVYLYSRSQWKKDECILLSSEDEDLQNKIMQRNKNVKDYIEKHNYELCTEDNEGPPVPDQVKEYEGRAIVLKNDSERIHCWASGCLHENSTFCKYNL